MNTFSKATVDFFDKNGNDVKLSDVVIEITHSNADRYSVIFLGALLVFASLFVMIMAWVIGLIALVATIFIVRKIGSNTPGKSSLKLNLKEKWFASLDDKRGRMSDYFEEIDKVGFKSDFVDEYSNAHKSTSKEYNLKVFMQLKSGLRIQLFTFQTEQLEPNDLINEIMDTLKETMKNY